jgi:hypothetical protein
MNYHFIHPPAQINLVAGWLGWRREEVLPSLSTRIQVLLYYFLHIEIRNYFPEQFHYYYYS